MGGETRRGGGMGGGLRANNGEEISSRLEEMAALRPLLSRIDLSRAQRDEEWALVRAYVPAEFYPQFDENASKAREEDLRRDRDMRARGTVRGGGMGGRGSIGDDADRSARGLTTEETASRFERMAELRPVLQRLDLSREQRDEAWAAVRACLPDTMRATFDANVARVREDETRAEERRREPL